MPTPPDLVKAVTSATGLPLATVTDLDRRLAIEGLRSKGGRGLHAAIINELDAARLLTAVLSSPQSVKAAEAVKRYGKTRPDKALSSDGLFKGIGIENLAALAPKHSFIEALAALITSAASGLLANPAAKARDGSPQLEVLAFTRATHGRIRISGLPRGVTTVVEYTPPSGERSSETNGDLEQSRRITEHTILAVAKLLEGQRQHGPQRT